MFCRVTVRTGLTPLTGVFGKAIEVGETDAVPATPLPERGTEWVPLSSIRMTIPVRTPAADGVNTTPKLQEALGASDVPQVFAVME